MKSRKGKYLLALALALVSLGVLGGGLYRQHAAQPAAVPAWVAALQSKPHGVAWKRKEVPLNTVNSRFRLNLPTFSADADWIVGIKPIAVGEKERMYVGLVTWEETTDKNGKSKNKAFKRISKMENFPEKSAIVTEGQASFSNILEADQTLVIYLEVVPLTEVDVAQDGSVVVLRGSEGSAVVVDGERQAAPFQGPATFLNEVHLRKLRKEAFKAGIDMKEARETP